MTSFKKVDIGKFFKRVPQKKKLVETEGARLLWELRDRWDPAGAAEEAHRPPHGKRASWSGNQLISLVDCIKIYENG